MKCVGYVVRKGEFLNEKGTKVVYENYRIYCVKAIEKDGSGYLFGNSTYFDVSKRICPNPEDLIGRDIIPVFGKGQSKASEIIYK